MFLKTAKFGMLLAFILGMLADAYVKPKLASELVPEVRFAKIASYGPTGNDDEVRLIAFAEGRTIRVDNPAEVGEMQTTGRTVHVYLRGVQVEELTRHKRVKIGVWPSGNVSFMDWAD
jgi:hypothetical protein